MKAVRGLAATGLLLATTGCLGQLATSYGEAPNPYQRQPVVHAVDYYPPPYRPAPYQPTPYQPAPLSPALTPQTTPVVGTNAGPPPVRYLPASQPPTSLLGPPPVHSLPAPQPPTSLLGPQRAAWN
ncbi:MAG: hypothetical protein HYZ40_11955 [Rhodospirillales bacterium]|nr:hypothetical protein [Rhodospirillales bacterium]